MGTLAINVFIAIFLQYFLAGRARDTRAEKDLLIEDVRDVIAKLRACADTLYACHSASRITEPQARTIKSLTRQLSNDILSLKYLVSASQCKKLASRCDGLQLDYVAFKRAATGGSFPTKPYNSIERGDQERAFRTLNSSLQALVFDINKWT